MRCDGGGEEGDEGGQEEAARGGAEARQEEAALFLIPMLATGQHKEKKLWHSLLILHSSLQNSQHVSHVNPHPEVG